jgi:hypothetical protein
MVNIMKLAKTLSRNEMKHIMAGYIMAEDGLCLYCWTPGGFGSWCRIDTGSDAESICEGIYPSYNKSEVEGNWQTGGTDCSSC